MHENIELVICYGNGGSEMKYNNYIPLEKISIRYKYFCFIDTKEYLADALFIKNRVRVRFQKEAHKPNTDFIVVFCKIKKCDTNKFLETLEELKKKMILLGHSDYQNFCKEFYESFSGEERENMIQ